MKKLIILVGLPASGKSTYAKKIAEQYKTLIVSSDDIREELDSVYNLDNDNLVFETFHNRIVEGLMDHNYDVVIADACHTTVERRLETGNNAKGIMCNIEIVYMNTDLETCLKRNKNRDKFIPEDAILRMYNKLEIPVDNDGFRKE